MFSRVAEQFVWSQRKVAKQLIRIALFAFFTAVAFVASAAAQTSDKPSFTLKVKNILVFLRSKAPLVEFQKVKLSYLLDDRQFRTKCTRALILRLLIKIA